MGKGAFYDVCRTNLRLFCADFCHVRRYFSCCAAHSHSPLGFKERNDGVSFKPAIMQAMQILRSSPLLARFVLMWFALSMGVALASPLVQPKGMQLVCSAAGAITVQFDQGDSGLNASQANTLDCPLCAAAGAPPPQVALQVLPPMGLAYAVQMPADPQSTRRSAAPLPPRGPPASA